MESFVVRPFLLAAPLLLLIPSGAALPVPPMPPGHLDYQIEDIEGDTMNIIINWTPPQQSELYGVSHYNVYMLATHEGGFRIVIPLESVEGANQFMLEDAPDTSTYLFYVTTVSTEGIESGPSNPVLVRQGYPHCGVIGWGIDPPHVHPTPGCLTPPPV